MAGSSRSREIDRTRYLRHLSLPEVGEAGQRRLLESSVLLVGAGGLGSPAALYLAAAGVGRIGLVDFDRVDATNLQRQVLFSETDVGRPKVEAARDRLASLNSSIELTIHDRRFDAACASEIIAGYDVALDGTDSFAARYVVNDACGLAGKPNVHGSIFRFDGQVTVYWPPRGPCYRCLFPEPPPPEAAPTCAEAGVLGVLPGVVGCLQATEALKIVLGVGEPLVGRLMMFDALAARFREVRIPRDPTCALCGEHPTITKVEDPVFDWMCQPPPSNGTTSMQHADITPEDLNRRRQAGETVTILDVRQPEEHAVARIEGARLIPLGELPNRLAELSPDEELIVHCKMGGRSSQACAFLRQQGFANVRNLTGGIAAWAERIEPTMAKP